MAEIDKHRDASSHHSLASALMRVLIIFVVVTFWSLMLSIAYAYRMIPTGLFGWIRLPAGISPFEKLNLGIADVVAYVALFVAILIAATVQQNSTIASAESIVDNRPTNAAEAKQQQKALAVYSSQAEMSTLVSFGAAFGVLMLACLFGLQEMALTGAADAAVDQHGVGWNGFIKSLHALAHPRVAFLFFVSLLLFMTTYASMPSWKSTGLFRRQVEDNAWAAKERLRLIAEEHDLDNVKPIKNPVGATAAAALGYLGYVVLFTVALNGLLVLLASGDGFHSLLASENLKFLALLSLVAITVSTTVGNLMLRMMHLQGQTTTLISVSLIASLATAIYIVHAEGAMWSLALVIAILAYACLWAALYKNAGKILDEKNPATWEFLVNPPKFIVMRRYERIRASAATLA
ncbi:hypothetical protein [Trueperella bialowiezensis]|uniref:Uncharacterized protein n=1 Tax=Trueperella bialowiezensis TaxID=312285 RepID=A0A3S4YZA8_9ACTO|nr:hypothetical protein [Trueperella bialowiezensis]VEI14068.1 Uncharacterised protein [Trueperella bialowiezensis]